MRYVTIIVAFLVGIVAYAQPPRRTPEDIARKQTGMMVRALHIEDSIVCDTLYRLHLKYARKRELVSTHEQAMQCIVEINAELQHILTPEQYQQFINQQVNHQPHHPKPRHHHRIHFAPCDTNTQVPPPNDTCQAPNKPLPLPMSPL